MRREKITDHFRISIRLLKDDLRDCRIAAAVRGIKPSELLREIVEKWLEKTRNDNDNTQG